MSSETVTAGSTGAAAGPPLRLDPRLDPRRMHEVFRRAGRLHVPGIFAPEVAARIHRALSAETPWTLHFNRGDDGHFDLSLADYEALTEDARRGFHDGINAGARAGFQYLFDNFPVSDLHAAGLHLDHYLMRVYEFMHSAPFLQWVRALTGFEAIVNVDMQATRYRAGHFLTTHDDAVEGKGRLAAYVLNFTPVWRADDGGLLQFIDRDGHVAEGMVPAFNALNVFRVPARHSVSVVAPWVSASRLSLTGWLRSSF